MPHLHETRMGQHLMLNDIPRLAKALEKMANELERLNKNLEYERKKNDGFQSHRISE